MWNPESRDDDIGQTSKEIIFDLPPEVSKQPTRTSVVRKPLLDTLKSNEHDPLLEPFTEAELDPLLKTLRPGERDPLATLGADPRDTLFGSIRSNARNLRAEARESNAPRAQAVESDAREARLEKESTGPVVNPFFRWLQRGVAALSILVIGVLVFLGAISAFRIVMDESPARSAVTPNAQPAAKLDVPANAQEPVESDVTTGASDLTTTEAPANGLEQSVGPFAFDSPSAAPSFATVNRARATTLHRKRVTQPIAITQPIVVTQPIVKVAAYESKRTSITAPFQPLVPIFTPTTLVIYIEKGEIKSRIEPWIQTPDN